MTAELLIKAMDDLTDEPGAVCTVGCNEIAREALTSVREATTESVLRGTDETSPVHEHEWVIDSERRPGVVFCLGCNEVKTS